MNLLWITDPHLDHIGISRRNRFFSEIKEKGADGILVTGDFADQHLLGDCLKGFADIHPDRPVYFVLGNHDFYGGSFSLSRRIVEEAMKDRPNLHHLTGGGIFEIGDGACLIGHDGWACGTAGLGASSTVRINDQRFVHDFAGMAKEEVFRLCRSLAEQSASVLGDALELASSKYRKVWIATHVPPFESATWHEGAQSSPEYLPWFCNKLLGEEILRIARENPECRFTVLCGHTHSPGRVQVCENLICVTGGAIYGEPGIVDVIKTGW